MKNKLPSHKLFEKYEYLVYSYANDVEIKDKSMTRDDIFQELRTKLFNAIIAYGDKCLEYDERKGERGVYKPMPLIMYLRRSLKFRLIDMIKVNNRNKTKKNLVNLSIAYSIESDGFDIGMFKNNGDNVFDMENKILIVNEVDLLEGFTAVEKDCYCKFAEGYNKNELFDMFRHKLPDAGKYINLLISTRNRSLKRKRSQLITPKNTLVEVHQTVEAE